MKAIKKPLQILSYPHSGGYSDLDDPEYLKFILSSPHSGGYSKVWFLF